MRAFVEYLSEVFERFGPIQSKRMFGGYGLYRDGIMFALVADDVLFLKADDETSGFFEAMGLGHFEYVKHEKVVKMSYYLAPEEIFDDPDSAYTWAQRAHEAAMRSKRPKKKAKKSK